MKTIILFIAVLISFGAKAQLSADSILIHKLVGVEYMLIDTFEKYSSDGVDTVWYSEIVRKKDLPIKNIGVPIVPNNDTTYKLTDNYKLDYLSSLKIVAYQGVKLFIPQKTGIPTGMQMFYLVKKRFQLDYPIEQFKEHPKVKAITDE